MVSNIFVYGTLLKGLERNHFLKQAEFIGAGFIKARMFEVDNYPGVSDGANIVSGEVYQLNTKKIRHLDYVEGYDSNNVSSSLFIRRSIKTALVGENNLLPAESYFLNKIDSTHQELHECDYRRYLVEKDSDLIPLAIIPSQLSEFRDIERLLSYNEYKKGWLMGYEEIDTMVDNKIFRSIKYRGSGRVSLCIYYLEKRLFHELDSKLISKGFVRISIIYKYFKYSKSGITTFFVPLPKVFETP